MKIYAVIIDAPTGRDCEFLDDKPTENLIAELKSLLIAGTISRAEIRVGNVNGGDSLSLWNGTPTGWTAGKL
jgi:hypothetical protein